MQPRYQLPPRQRAARNLSTDFRPDQVEAWLAAFSTDGALPTAERLGRFLTAFNRIELPAEHRRTLLGSLRPACQALADSLRSALAEAGPGEADKAIELARTLFQELGNTYKLAALDALETDPTPSAGIGLLEGVFFALGQLMALHYVSHEALPEGVWSDLHQSYACALHYGLCETAVDHGGRQTTLDTLYKSALLLAMSDPYQFSAQELAWAQTLAEHMAPLARLYQAQAPDRPMGNFHIDCQGDGLPQPLALNHREHRAQDGLLMVTAEVAKQLALQAIALRNGRPDQLPEHCEPAQQPDYLNLLNKLRLRWGSTKHRLAKRRQFQSSRDYEVCFGLEGLLELTGQTGAPGRTLRCTPVNDSLGGLALMHRGPMPSTIAVGAAIGFRQEGDLPWRLGVVRWFQRQRLDAVIFGLQFLAPSGQAVKVRCSRGERPPFGGFLLRMPGDEALSGSLLLPRGKALPGGEVTLDTPDGHGRFRLESRTEITPAIEIYRIEPA